MSDTDVDPSTAPPPGGGGQDPAAGPPGAPPGNPQPPGGGPMLAALARGQSQPPVSAPGMGNMAQGLMQVKMAVDMLQNALQNLAPGSQQHRDVVRAIGNLSRHLPQGAPTAGVQQTSLQDMLRNTIRNAMLQKLMSQRGAGGGPQGPPGAQSQPPVPSTPLPGA